MVVKYPNGRAVEGLLLSRQENSMRVALEGSQDVVEFFRLQNNWVSEQLENVEIAFEWQRRPAPAPLPEEENFICPQDLAAHLIRLLKSDSEEEERRSPPKYLTAAHCLM